MWICMCSPPKLLIIGGMIWALYDWLNKFYSFYMAAIVDNISGRGPSIDVYHTNQPI